MILNADNRDCPRCGERLRWFTPGFPDTCLDCGLEHRPLANDPITHVWLDSKGEEYREPPVWPAVLGLICFVGFIAFAILTDYFKKPH